MTAAAADVGDGAEGVELVCDRDLLMRFAAASHRPLRIHRANPAHPVGFVRAVARVSAFRAVGMAVARPAVTDHREDTRDGYDVYDELHAQRA
jgi:hypothetical protein